MAVLELVVGPINSGKSAWAEARLLEAAGDAMPLYVATLARQGASRGRIETHRARRGDRWRLIEVVSSLLEVGAAPTGIPEFVLLDGLIAHVNQRLIGIGEQDIRSASDRLLNEYALLLKRMTEACRHVIIVTTSVGREAVLRGATDADRRSIEICHAMCRSTLQLGAALWLCRSGIVERVEPCRRDFE
jgi:adenosyl cobinamide kinase/adenosyl cobinamide phosphate guanylyltransferase